MTLQDAESIIEQGDDLELYTDYNDGRGRANVAGVTGAQRELIAAIAMASAIEGIEFAARMADLRWDSLGRGEIAY